MGPNTKAEEAGEEVETSPQGQIRPIMETLARLQEGKLMDRLSIELNRVVKGVAESTTGKGGTVTLTLKIDPIKRISNGVYVAADVKGKAPEDPPEASMFFYDDDGSLHSRNPLQRDAFEDGLKGI